MLGIVEKVKDLFKRKAEKRTKAKPRQEDPTVGQMTEEQDRPPEETSTE